MLSAIESAVKFSLLEDVADGDITSSLLDNTQIANATIIAREKGILCGCPWVYETYRQINSAITCQWNLSEGEWFTLDTVIATFTGPVADLLTGERTALNWLQTLSGTATTTATYLEALRHTNIQLLDTRKTIPTLRYAQKYAVRCGGGKNHRMGLFDAFLIKENHINAYGSIKNVIAAARRSNSSKVLEIEVQNLTMLQEALLAKPDIILLDNFNLKQIEEAVALAKGQVTLEVSGNVTQEMLFSIAKLNVDYISVGAITKNVSAIDFSFLIQHK
jgi:nicotinate-nucleotide pyrophosphorylase (carboxylating)